MPGATAIAKGIAAGHSVEKPGYWIHLTGTAILTWYDVQHQRYGEAPLPEQRYHDIEDIQRLVTIPDGAPHRNVDKIVQGAISDSVKVAMVCPPTIYGTGHGAVNTRSIQVPDMVLNTLEKGFAPIVSPGLTEWDNVHIWDLADVFLKLVNASQNPLLRTNPEIFGLNGYFFAENGAHRWSDVARWIAEEASKQGYLPEPLTKFVTQKEVEQMEGIGGPSWGLNSKGVAQRARRYLGWDPKHGTLREGIPDMITQEARARGVSPKEKKG